MLNDRRPVNTIYFSCYIRSKWPSFLSCFLPSSLLAPSLLPSSLPSTIVTECPLSISSSARGMSYKAKWSDPILWDVSIYSSGTIGIPQITAWDGKFHSTKTQRRFLIHPGRLGKFPWRKRYLKCILNVEKEKEKEKEEEDDWASCLIITRFPDLITWQ